MDSYILLNLLEALFWVALGVSVLGLRGAYAARTVSLRRYTASMLALFGLSDIVEALVGNFLDSGMEWLFVWKLLNVAALVAAFVWYFRARSNFKQ